MNLRRSDAARLDRRPEATAYQVDDILVLLADGRIRVPPFQRPIRWRNKDRVDLLDSIYRGFPIGTLLLWKHKAAATSIVLGDFKRDVPERPDALWVVDGQQRLATLASALLVPHLAGERAIQFRLDAPDGLDTPSFQYLPVRETSPNVSLALEASGGPELRAIPLHIIFDEERLIECLSVPPLSFTKTLRARAVECGKRLRQYRVPAYVVDTGDASDEEAEALLREVFERTNRTGRRLDEVDAFSALFSTVVEGERYDLDRIVRAVVASGWGNLDPKAALYALRAVLGLSVDRDYTKELERDATPEAVRRTEAAVLRATTFLRDSADIPNAALNPYELPLVVLARFFDRFPEPTLRTRILLRRWVWRGALGATLGGASASRRQHVDAVHEGDEHGSVQRLFGLTAPGPSSTDVTFPQFRMRTARSCLELCGLASLQPRDLATGEPLNIGDMFRETVAPRLLAISEKDQSPRAESIANILLHHRLSSGEARRLLGAASTEVLASHAIPEEARAAFVRGDTASAIELRATAVAQVLGDFFRSHAEFGADDSPPLEALLVPEEQ